MSPADSEPRRPVAVVTDSAAGLGPSAGPRTPWADLLSWEGLRVLPLPVLVDGRPLETAGDDASGDDAAGAVSAAGSGGEAAANAEVAEPEVAEAAAARTALAVAAAEGRVMSTSRPAPEAFAAAYRELAERGFGHVVSVHLSGELSGTVSGARAAATESPIPVTVVDSRSVAMGQGAAVLAAAAAARSGASPAEVVRAADGGSRPLLFVIPTLEHVARSGRIPRAWALVGQMFGIRPVGTVQDGRLRYLERPRSLEAAEEALEALLLRQVEEALQEADGQEGRDGTSGRGPRETGPSDSPAGVPSTLVLQEFWAEPSVRAVTERVRERWVDRVRVVTVPLPEALAVHTGLGTWAGTVLPGA